MTEDAQFRRDAEDPPSDPDERDIRGHQTKTFVTLGVAFVMIMLGLSFCAKQESNEYRKDRVWCTTRGLTYEWHHGKSYCVGSDGVLYEPRADEHVTK